jgi:DNA-binding transcriptional MerR regulator
VQVEYTIDQLARVADTTVRSVRVYHERGLLPAPQVRGRIGYYGAAHLTRLQTISRLLNRGMKLTAIRELLDAWDRGDGLADVLGVPSPSSGTHTSTASFVPPNNLSGAGGTHAPLAGDRRDTPHCTELADLLITSGLDSASASSVIEQLRAECHRIAEHHASELCYRLAGQFYENSELTATDRAKLGADTAAARRAVTRAIAELIDEGFVRHSHRS